jgi:vacuolar-type H+-ATPase subunit H
LTGSLDTLKQAELEARQEIEDARREAAAKLAGIPGEITSLEEELTRRVGAEARKREAAIRGGIATERESLLRTAEDGAVSLGMKESRLVDGAFDILVGLLSGRTD